MQTRQTIIEQYLAAGEEERLLMFLRHRECRRQFVKIDMAALKAVRAKKAATQAALQRRSRHMEVHNVFLGWLKRCCTVR
jgi:hypothetical protein